MSLKLYGTFGTCSLAVHIALREAGLPFDFVMVDLQTRKTSDDRDLTALNEKGYVPVLELEDGQTLTEVPAVLQYIAALAPEKGLAPPTGTMARYRLQEWLSFINSELHKAFGPLFNPMSSEEAKAQSCAKVMERLTWVDRQLGQHTFLLGGEFTVADAYLFVAAGWTKFVGIDISELKRLGVYCGQVAGRPAVQEALRAEGLIT